MKQLKYAIGLSIVSFGSFGSYYTIKHGLEFYYNQPGDIYENIKRKNIDSKNDSSIRKELDKSFFKFHNESGSKFDEMGIFRDPYFITDKYYQISNDQAQEIIKATYKSFSMILRATDFVINQNPSLMNAMDIPKVLQPIIQESWNQKRSTDVLSRLDFLVDQNGNIKLLELNGDTPMLLVETVIGQKIFDKFQKMDDSLSQFNILEELIKNAFHKIQDSSPIDNYPFYFLGHKHIREELCTIDYLASLMPNGKVDDITKLTYKNSVLAVNGQRLNKFWKLYPLEWLAEEIPTFFQQNQNITDHMVWLEPPWKLVASNKGLLPILKMLYPDSPYLLQSNFSFQHIQALPLEQIISKRVFGREGLSVIMGKSYVQHNSPETLDENKKQFLIHSHEIIDSHDSKACMGKPIFQEYFQTPKYSNRSITIGSWLVQGIPAGFAIREDLQGLTNDHSSFVTNYIKNFEKSLMVSQTSIEQQIRDNIYGTSHIKDILNHTDIKLKVIKDVITNENVQDLTTSNKIFEIISEDVSASNQENQNQDNFQRAPGGYVGKRTRSSGG